MTRRSNADRAQATREALLAAGRRLFADQGFAATGTPRIAAEAGVTRGALYHHFADKTELFAAVVEAEQAAVAGAIEAAAGAAGDPVGQIVAGGEGFIAAMAEPGRRRILLIDGPAVLGRERLEAGEAAHARRTLDEGLAAAMAARLIRPAPVRELSDLLGALFDRAALVAVEGDRGAYGTALRALVEGLRV
jgi:AcrR family transcriptional regulator